MRILVIGGTGPTGPYIVNGLVERGHDVTIFHTGRHEVDSLPPESVVPHIHGDPFDLDSTSACLDGQTFDVVLLAGNGEPIGRSQMYSSKAAMEKGIACVKKDGPGARVDDAR